MHHFIKWDTQYFGCFNQDFYTGLMRYQHIDLFNFHIGILQHLPNGFWQNLDRRLENGFPVHLKILQTIFKNLFGDWYLRPSGRNGKAKMISSCISVDARCEKAFACFRGRQDNGSSTIAKEYTVTARPIYNAAEFVSANNQNMAVNMARDVLATNGHGEQEAATYRSNVKCRGIISLHFVLNDCCGCRRFSIGSSRGHYYQIYIPHIQTGIINST